jgi:hypothetical protein
MPGRRARLVQVGPDHVIAALGGLALDYLATAPYRLDESLRP